MSFESLNLASNALRSHRLAMDVAARNLTGAAEPNYTRQVVTYNEDHSAPRGRYSFDIEGLGTRISAIQRARNGLLDQVYRSQRSLNGTEQAKVTYATSVETALSGQPSLSNLLGKVQSGLTQLQGDPANLGLRQAWLGQVEAATNKLRSTAASLDENGVQAKTDLSNQLTRANQIFSQLSQLNPRIVGATPDTTGYNGMLDQRDGLLDELSEIVDFQANLAPTGSVEVYLQGVQMVSGDRAGQLQLDSSYNISNERGTLIQPFSGSLRGIQDHLRVDLPEWKAQLDSLATTWISQANEVHSRNYGLDGVTGRNLLQGTGARDIGLALTDPRQLGHASSLLEGTTFAQPGLISDQALSSQSSAFTTPPSASGVIRVNGTDIAWDANTDNLNGLLDKFRLAGVEPSYQTNSRSLTLTRNTEVAGASQVEISDISGNLRTALGLNQTPRPAGSADNSGLNALSNRLNSNRYGPAADRSLTQLTGDLQVAVGSSLKLREGNLQSSQQATQVADTQRRSTSGVSSDQELLDVTRMQQAFAAAARVASAADEMLSTIISMGAR
jgi:flagellar hook-associated protein 1 FlgK